MKGIYALRDMKAEVFAPQLVFEYTDATAIRMFADACRDPETACGKHPEDYHLFAVGSWDEFRGVLVGHEPRSIINGAQAREVKE